MCSLLFICVHFGRLRRGSGWTTSSYDGSTPALTDLPAFPTEAAGPSTNLLSGTDDQSGENDTSYNFQTYAAFNGIDWSETGEKIATGTGDSINSFSASASGLTLKGTPGFPPATAPASGLSVTNGTVNVSGTSGTDFSYTQYAYLDDNGVWQDASSPSSDGSWFGTTGTLTWSASGSGSFAADVVRRLFQRDDERQRRRQRQLRLPAVLHLQPGNGAVDADGERHGRDVGERLGHFELFRQHALHDAAAGVRGGRGGRGLAGERDGMGLRRVLRHAAFRHGPAKRRQPPELQLPDPGRALRGSVDADGTAAVSGSGGTSDAFSASSPG